MSGASVLSYYLRCPLFLLQVNQIKIRLDQFPYGFSLGNQIYQRKKIDLLIPLIDSELSLLASAVDRFAELRCTALVSSSEVVDICGDKIAWYERLRGAGIETPRTWSLAEALARKRNLGAAVSIISDGESAAESPDTFPATSSAVAVTE